jgi:hypothetical protein
MRLNRDVTRLLATHGYDLTLKRVKVGGTYDTTTGTVTGGATSTATIRGVFIDYNEQDIDGTNVLADDRKLLVQADGLTLVPEVGDFVDDEVRIERVRKIQSGATVIAYICQTRG